MNALSSRLRIPMILLMAWFWASFSAWGQTSTVVGWGLNDDGQAAPPAGLTDVLRVAGCFRFSLAVRGNGTVAGWGNSPGVPAGLNGVAALATRGGRNQALRSNGTVVAWSTFEPDFAQKVPAGLSNVIAVAEGGSYSLALKADGSVTIWGNGSRTNLPPGLSNIVAIAAAGDVAIAARSDGIVLAWNGNGLVLPGFVPPGLSNVVAVAASHLDHCMALKSDGTVVNWGRSAGGVGPVPVGLSNVVAIAAEGLHAMAVRSDGSVVAWGSNDFGESKVPARVTNVTAIALGTWHSLAVIRSAPASWPRLTAQPESARKWTGQSVTFSVAADALAALSYRWQFRGQDLPQQTNVSLVLDDVQVSQAGDYAVVVSAGGLSVRSAPAFLVVSNGPAADAGPDQIVECRGTQTRVVLDARGSRAGDDAHLTFSWFEDARLLGTDALQEAALALGTHTIRLAVSNSAGASSQDSVTVQVVDTTPPFLECPVDLAVEFAGATGALVNFSVAGVDVCGEGTSVCVPSSGHIFVIGSTPVHCSAVDEAGNRASCSFNISVLGPRSVKQELLAELEALRAGVYDERDVRRLNHVTRQLTGSLEPAFWWDETHLIPPQGHVVFEQDQLAAHVLRKTAEAKPDPAPGVTWQGIIAQLLRVDRFLAALSIEESVAAGASARKVEEARRELAAGDAAAAAGRPETAIERYGIAWMHAVPLRVRIVWQVGADRPLLQFIGWPEETYRIESTTNLIDWRTLRAGIADAEGMIEFEDGEASRGSVKLYRAVALEQSRP